MNPLFCHGNILWSHCLVRIMHNLKAFYTTHFKNSVHNMSYSCVSYFPCLEHILIVQLPFLSNFLT